LSTKVRRYQPFSYGWSTGRQEFERAGPWSNRTVAPFYSPSVWRSNLTAPGLAGTQETASESHPLWRKVTQGIPLNLEEASRGGDILANIGGDFTMKRTYVASPVFTGHVHWVSPWNTQNPAWRWVYDGPVLIPYWQSFTFPPSASSSESELQALGAKAVANCAPTNSIADLGVTLAEVIREGAPKLLGSLFWRSRTKDLKELPSSAGSEYLNAEFGWKPLVSDVTDLAKGVVNLDRVLEQLIRDSGRQVRRSYFFPTVYSESSTVIRENISAELDPGHSSFYGWGLTNKGRVVRYRQTTIRRWFKGAFTYHLPPEWREGLMGSVAAARDLLGLNLTPEVLWNLAPWSWAVDWFAGIGDVLHNADAMASDGLVIRYGYVMEHSLVRDTFIFEGETGFEPQFTGFPAPLSLVTEVKLRRKATPFGFGLSSGLTNRQAAIIAALGASRTS
jgi:hypothetical protein